MWVSSWKKSDLLFCPGRLGLLCGMQFARRREPRQVHMPGLFGHGIEKTAGNQGMTAGGPVQDRFRTIFVISGGQLTRMGMPTVPIPRETYIEVLLNRYDPQTYGEKSEAGVTVSPPSRPRTTCPPWV